MKANHVRRVDWWLHFLGRRAGTKGSPQGRTRLGLLGPARVPKNAATNPSYMFAFLFKYASICFLVGFSCFLMTSSLFYVFFDDIFMLFEGASDG